MNSINDDKLYSLGLEHYKRNKLDNSYDYLVKIKNKNLNTYKLISNIHIKKNDFKSGDKEILLKTKDKIKDEIYSSYDQFLNQNYKVEINYNTLERTENYFK